MPHATQHVCSFARPPSSGRPSNQTGARVDLWVTATPGPKSVIDQRRFGIVSADHGRVWVEQFRKSNDGVIRPKLTPSE